MVQITWNKRILEAFEDLAMLNEDEKYILESRVRGESVTQQSMHLNCSASTVHRKISAIKRKYDRIQQAYPDEFPKRRTSKEEQWMDTH